MLSDLPFRLRFLFRRNTVEEELDEKLGFHLERQIDKHVKSGLTREEAVHSPVAVISYRFWQRRFDRDASVMGKRSPSGARYSPL